ncbi:23S rRNA (uracil(1939)-C(5))-methyltransferase RlmD [Candidatus Xianfuyuplasma coldseepsis]|uniref:23S rRNA (Uracil(1939)-C(5))-methyltransferase RlmD n=1 Tax=Candidatus Xianfuyuplasma coldseepsis TaxID=2782163 RepID=A0A7L7KPV2_9MOLU|nr:23S rRNA (uracil(1939)-C(5))-methyltransferase RlmD [Xianfuyuplasma coldseepsis]QMS84743.1 23S rRNA (uracil(1939)-C(5))-methyltransferase RlmD [Xianfuyuplasma coldseepsis]
MVEKNEYYAVEFVDMTHDGMGVCKVDGFPIFVPNALKGEKADIKVVKVNQSFGFGRLIEITHKSPFRKEPICDHFSECGGCNLMHMNYQMQLDFKKHRVKETLRKLGKIHTSVKDAVGMLNPYYYRNKTVVPFGEENGKMIAGLYRKRSHDIIDMKRCYIIPKITTDIVKFLKNIFEELNIPAYNETVGVGVVRHVLIRNSYKYDDISVTIVTLTPKLPKKELIVKKLVSRYKNIVSVVHNFNPDNTNVVLGKKSKVLFGDDFIRDEINGVEFKISHRSFYQINPAQTEEMYRKAIEYADLTANEVIIDAYCGIGTIGLSAAKYAKTVLGVDVVKSAIEDAMENAKNNNITNAKYVAGKAEKVIKHWKNYDVDVLFIDPPRKGCDKDFLETIVEMKIPRVVYISCNVSTLARDLNYLQSQGYEVLEVTPFDMFPQTSHIETVSKLRLKKQD